LITSAARSAAAVIEGLPDVTPAKALTILNRAIHQTSKGQIMMTFFIACIDLDKSLFTYASASHDPPYLMRKSGEKLSKKDLVPLNDVNGPRLGDQKDFQYDETSLEFEPGDLVFLYTDGIVDIQDPAGKKWGERAFLKSLIDSSNDGADIEAKLGGLRGRAEAFRSGSSLIDDVTMVMCEYEKRAA
jgi:sigma-B regulation protein RsbU (phosphoserine phosphatase)